jgi:flagellin-like protein
MDKEHKRGRKIFSKKAVSGVVTTVLLILIVLAAIGIVWATVSSFLKQGTQGIEGAADCFSLQLNLESAINDSSAGTGNNIKVRVQRVSGEGNITAIKFLVDGADTPFTGVMPSPSETRTFSARIVNPEPIGKEVEIAAVVGSKICGVADSAIITAS